MGTESLADIGAAVLSGAISTFLAVVVLLFSSSYVFRILSTQFALTVGLGLLHGLVLLPVLLSILGPPPFASAEKPQFDDEKIVDKTTNKGGSEDDDESGESPQPEPEQILSEVQSKEEIEL